MTSPPTQPVPATLMAAVRYLIGILVPIAVQRGWLGENEAANLSALAVAGVTVGYGLWKTHERQAQLNRLS